MITDPTPFDWRQYIHRLHAEAAGLVTIEAIMDEDVPSLIAGCLAGDRDVMAVFQTVSNTVQGVRTAPSERPVLCGSCPRPLTDFDFSVVIARAARPLARRGIAFAICSHCGVTREQVQGKAVNALARIWPDARAVTLTPGGRA